MSESIRDKVKDVIAATLGVNLERIVDEANIFSDFYCDEFDLVELTVELEEAFKIEISDDEMDAIQDVKALVEYVEKKLVDKG